MSENLSVGLALTVIGMSLVFAVLALLAVAIVLLVKVNDKFAARQPAPGIAAGHEAPHPTSPDPDELVAIALAVRLHQVVRRKQAAPAMRTHQPGTLPSRWLTAGRTRQNRSWHRRG